jgi:hypothetical protein
MAGVTPYQLTCEDKMSLIEQNQKIIEKYRNAGEKWPATKVEIARWAIAKKLWDIHPAKIVRQCAEQIGDAMREDYVYDPQGRKVRVKHAAPYEVQGRLEFRWDDMRTAEPLHMASSFTNQRNQMVNICHQLKQSIDSYNENWNKTGRPYQGKFDFTNDLAELELEERSKAEAKARANRKNAA